MAKGVRKVGKSALFEMQLAFGLQSCAHGVLDQNIGTSELLLLRHMK